MSNFIIIIFCLLIGYVFRRVNLAGKNDYKIVNTWVIYVGLPSIALLYIPRIEWNISYIFTAALPVTVF
jgi:predicted permease